MLKVNFYKNKRQNDKNFGKVYVRASNSKPITIAELSEHMAEHSTVFSPATVLGVLTEAVKCIRELCLMGVPVKLENLCIVKPSVLAKPANDVEHFDLKENIKGVRLQFTGTGKCTRAEITDDAMIGYTSLAKRIKNGELILSNTKGEYIEDVGGNDGGGTVNP